MACSVCDRTLQKIDDRPVFWCPNCGTINEHTGSFVRTEQPALLRRLVEQVTSAAHGLTDTLPHIEIEMGDAKLKSIRVNGREIL